MKLFEALSVPGKLQVVPLVVGPWEHPMGFPTGVAGWAARHWDSRPRTRPLRLVTVFQIAEVKCFSVVNERSGEINSYEIN